MKYQLNNQLDPMNKLEKVVNGIIQNKFKLQKLWLNKFNWKQTYNYKIKLKKKSGKKNYKDQIMLMLLLRTLNQ